MGVTKTDYMRGMQCPKMLWLDKHKPELKIIPPEVQEALDKGNEFGDRAMGMFGEYIEMTTYREDGRLDFSAMLQKTQEHLQDGTPVLCEAAFRYYGNYCAVDILRRTDSGFSLYEVKNSDGVKEQFVKDVGFQLYILTRCHVRVVKCFIVTRGEEPDRFAVTDVTAQAREYSRTINDNIWRLGKIKMQKEEVEAETGTRCEQPYRCWYWEYCHAEEKK